MNQKTSKLIEKYAFQVNEPKKKIKKHWKSLEWKQRDEERVKMEKAVGK